VEWLFEKHGISKRRSSRKFHIGIAAGLDEIVAARALTVLRRLAKRGAAVKHGTSRDAKWTLNVHAF
jgi:hypothetical protein